MNKKKGTGISHSKIILIGEHSVFSGSPAIAIPIKNIEIQKNVEKSSINRHYSFEEVLPTAIQSALEYLGKKDYNLKYAVKSSIPPKRGMGSSAAVSIAGIRAVFDFFDMNLEKNVLEELVNRAEIIAHRTPSGLDAKTCLSDRAIKFIKNKGFENLELNTGCYLLIADTGVYGKTRDAIENVRKMGDRALENLKKLGELAENIEKNIKEKDIVTMGQNMTLAHRELQKINVSIKKSDDLVDEALLLGALGAKMSGGGLGGCIIALTDSKEKAEKIGKKLRGKGAVNTWIEIL